MDVNEEQTDYEKRENLATFMSWSSVVVLGRPTDGDIEEYVMMEVLLQSDWYLIHRKERMLPRTMDDARERKFTSVEMRMDQYELDRYIKETTYHSGSTLPARFNEIQKGLLLSSGLREKAARYIKMSRDMGESMMYDDQMRQSRYGRVSEILLLVIAVLNISNVVYSITSKTNEAAAVIILGTFIAIGAFVVWRK